MIHSLTKQQLRKQLREKRQALSVQQQLTAAQNLSLRISKSKVFKNAKSIAVYLSQDGEIDLIPLIKLARANGKKCFLPTLSGKKLKFVEWHKASLLKKNRFGIAEPKSQTQITAQQLDLILMPLVGFDKKGNRLGMGGGFYDRTLASLQYRYNKKPKLIGVAHEFQQCKNLQADPWDIPLDIIATNKNIFLIRN